MRQRKYVAGLNMDRLRTVHALIDRLVPAAPLTPEAIAALKKAATACGAEITGSRSDAATAAARMIREMVEDSDPDFFDIPEGETSAARRKLKKLLNPDHGRRRGFIK